MEADHHLALITKVQVHDFFFIEPGRGIREHAKAVQHPTAGETWPEVKHHPRFQELGPEIPTRIHDQVGNLATKSRISLGNPGELEGKQAALGLGQGVGPVSTPRRNQRQIQSMEGRIDGEDPARPVAPTGAGPYRAL